MGFDRKKKEEKIRKILLSIYVAFPRSDTPNEAAMGIWTYALRDFPLEKIGTAASRWIREEKWPPDNLNKFINAVCRKEAYAQEEDDPAYREFLKEYRAQGLGRVLPAEDTRPSKKTTFEDAKIWRKMLVDIMEKRLRAPKSIAHHDVGAHGDREEQFLVAEFERRKNGG